MDIAAFIGFAAAGPLHRPVVVEDVAQFRDLFGDDLPLAWDEERGEEIHAYLAPAVRAFFRNGGRRCWVIRVAVGRTANSFLIPGLAHVVGTDLEQASAKARSQGSSFDSIQAATALSLERLDVLHLDLDSQTLQFALPSMEPIRPGDLMRLNFREGRWQAFFVADSAEPAFTSVAGAEERITARGRFVAWLQALTREDLEASPPMSPELRIVQEVLEGRVTLRIPDSDVPVPGTLKFIAWGDLKLWISVEDATQIADTASPPERRVEITGRAFSHQALAPTGISDSLLSAERITFELRARDILRHREWRIGGLGFAAAHARCWSALPDDEALFGPADRKSVAEQEYDRAHADLMEQARDPRFPIAGRAHDDLKEEARESRSRLAGSECGKAQSLFIPIGMDALPGPYLAGSHEAESSLEREGLNQFEAGLFLEEALQGAGLRALLGQADFLRYQSETPRELMGIHAALEVEEATLIAVPDAVHRGWTKRAPEAVNAPSAATALPHPTWWRCRSPDQIPVGVPPPYGEFLRCSLQPIAPPVWMGSSRNLRVEPPGTFKLAWTSQAAEAVFVLEESPNHDFLATEEIYRGRETQLSFLSHTLGAFYYRVRAEVCGETSDWSEAFVVEIQPASLFVVIATKEFRTAPLLDIQRSLLRLCAARGDLMAVLALPGHFREDEALAHLAQLKPGSRREPLGDQSAVFPIGTGEAHALSYGAVYHPWLLERDEEAGVLENRPLRRVPPDGTAAGVIARRSLERGAWIAPANEPVSGVIGLDPPLAADRQLDLLLAQLNQVRQEPYGFITLNADTLAEGDFADLRRINVRRLLILLRRAALKLGMNYVFEPNDAAFRRLVQDAFTGLLDRMFARGAFAGPTPATSYQVVTDDSLNPRQGVEQGRFFVDLRVAPALPMSFVTVRLVQTGERAAAVELR